MSTGDDRDVAEADRVAAEVGRVEAEGVRVVNELDEDVGRVTAEGVRVGDEDVRVKSEGIRAEGESAREAAEAGRAEAEALREKREDRRRMNEGGPDNNNVEGKPPGTTGRVEAEQEREHHAHQTMRRVAALIALPVALVSLLPSLLGLVLLEREISHRCADSALNRTAIRAAVTDGLPTLGYRYDPSTNTIVRAGEPTVEYYLTHPDERDDALARTKAILDRFPPIGC